MLSLSSAPLFPSCGLWPPPFEEENDNNIAETDYSNSFPPPPDQLPNYDWYRDPFHGYAAVESRSESQARPITPVATNMVMTNTKKLNHNASERDRRKKVNSLYAFLRSLLPTGDQKKKVSIPGTVSRALKYIPELQSEVAGLVEKRAKILMSSSSASCTTLEEKDIVGVSIKKQVVTKNHHATIGRNLASCLSSVSVALVGDRQVVIQLNNKGTTLSLSRVLEYLDLEEGGGLVLVNGSSFKSFAFRDPEKHFNTLCFQVQENYKIDVEMLKQKLLSFHYRH